MKHKISITSIVRKNKSADITAHVAHHETPFNLSVSVPMRKGDSESDFQNRVKRALMDEIADQEAASRSKRFFRRVATAPQIEISYPGKAHIDIHDGLLEGWVGEDTEHLLVVVSLDGEEREVKVTPNRNNRYCVALNGYKIISVIPVSPDGVLGEEQI